MKTLSQFLLVAVMVSSLTECLFKEPEFEQGFSNGNGLVWDKERLGCVGFGNVAGCLRFVRVVLWIWTVK